MHAADRPRGEKTTQHRRTLTSPPSRGGHSFWTIDSPRISGMRIWVRWLDAAEQPIRNAAWTQGIDVRTITFSLRLRFRATDGYAARRQVRKEATSRA